MTLFRKILLSILIVCLINALVFKAPLYPLSHSEIKKESNELSREFYLEMQHLPLVFIHKQKVTGSINSNLGSPLQIIFGVYPLKTDLPKFATQSNLNHTVLGRLIPIFIWVRSLRN